jgi:NitT/TauT family transport system permease protein
MTDEPGEKGAVEAPPPPEENAAAETPSDAAAVVGAGGGEALQYGDLGERQRPRQRKPSPFLALFLPNRAVSPGAMQLLVAAQVAAALVLWLNSPFKVLPRPDEVFRALHSLWFEQGMGPELGTSLTTSLEALAWTTLFSLALSYLTVLPVFRPLVAAVSKGRFLSLAGFTFVFTLIVGGGHPLKIWLLVFAMTVFFVTSMASVIAQIPRERFDHARTLRMSEWQVVWEVVVLGTVAEAFEVLRQNAAIGWMMLTMVEGISRSQGGVGAMLLNQQKHFHLAEVFAIQILILTVGLLQDGGIVLLRRLACPYAALTLERA